MKLTQRFALVLVLSSASCAAAQVQRPPSAPPHAKVHHQREDILDFALEKINPQDIDYGQRIEALRMNVVYDGLLSLGFWSTWLPPIMMLVAFGAVLWKDNDRKRREIITAHVLCWYHNGLVDAHRENTELRAKCAQFSGCADHQPIDSNTAAGSKSSAQNASEQQVRAEVEQLRAENQQVRDTNKGLSQNVASLRQQVTTLTRRLEEEQQKNRKFQGA